MKKAGIAILFFLCLTFIFIPVVGQNTFAEGSDFDAQQTHVYSEEKVYLGGIPIGVIANSEGIIVTDYVEVISPGGVRSPAREAGLMIGDLIVRINGVSVSNVADIKRVIDKTFDNKPLQVEYMRESTYRTAEIMPSLDLSLKEYKLGILAKNDIAGVGTLTYLRASDGRFGGLGHRIYDNANSKTDLYKKGNIFGCTIVGCIKGSEGKAGELKGVFEKCGKPRGSIDKNNDYGIFGYADKDIAKDLQTIEIGTKNSVKMGKAYIYTTIDGGKPEKYAIEIIKNVQQSAPGQKGMVLRITDERLLEKTGGIVQGMSGSPIIQNDKLIGAVTHVFLNDSTKGYGVYIDWMIEN
ncbi:MAG: SpoIVB peptidase [Clostridia bacterium]|nr:SpoIVB peptidase [Clostridia bacterium]